MRNFLKLLIIAPLALIFLVFALSNRQNVVVTLDPFYGGDDPSTMVVLPLFVVLIGATMVGVLLGGVATWLRQGRFRKALRDAKGQVETLRGENESLRAQVKALQAPANSSTAIVPTRAA
ncbi:LapA family protein [Rhodoblastus sp.]|uniref:LapA family protein n=1 Tax=Rhodoblastus sp. TaxID=1962975 RepID=UPI0035B3D1C3